MACFPRYRYKGDWKLRANCKDCQKAMTESWRERNKEHVKGYERKYREDNRDAIALKIAKWRSENKDKITEYNRQRYWENPDKHRESAIKAYWDDVDANRARSRSYASLPENKEIRKKNMEDFKRRNPTYFSEYTKANRQRYAEHAARRRIHQYKSSANLTEDQIQQIRDIYWHARDLSAVTGEPYEVDHIIPIRGENVCGLHVPWNLQILPRDLNRAKRNQYNVEDAIAT